MSDHKKPIINVEFIPLKKHVMSPNKSLSVKVKMSIRSGHVMYDLEIIGFGFKRIRRDQLLDIVGSLHRRKIYEKTKEIVSIIEIDGPEHNRLPTDNTPIAKRSMITSRLSHPFDFFI